MSNLTKEEKINKFIEFMKVSEVSAYEVSKTTKVTEAAIGRILNKKGTNPHSKTVDSLYNFSINYQKKTITFLEKMTGVGIGTGLAALAAGAVTAPISITSAGIIGLGGIIASKYINKNNITDTKQVNTDLNEKIENLSELLIQTNKLIDQLKSIKNSNLEDLMKLKEAYTFKSSLVNEIKELTS